MAAATDAIELGAGFVSSFQHFSPSSFGARITGALNRDDNALAIYVFCWSMILSENRCPLFRIMP